MKIDQAETCLVCDGGIPNEENSQCVSFGSDEMLQNCLYGMTTDVTGSVCIRCKAGFGKDEDGKCVSDGIIGCSLFNQDEDGCFLCDFWDNWTVNSDGSCTKVGRGEEGVRGAGFGDLMRDVVKNVRGKKRL